MCPVVQHCLYGSHREKRTTPPWYGHCIRVDLVSKGQIIIYLIERVQIFTM